MKRSKTLAVLAVLSISLAACAGGAASLSDADIAAIEEVSASFAAAANANDWGGVAALYTEDAVLMPPNGPAVEGQAAIEAFFAAYPPFSGFTLNPVEIDGRGDLAFVRGTYSLTLEIEGMEPTPDTGKYIEIRRRQPDGSWLLAADIFNSDVPLEQ